MVAFRNLLAHTTLFTAFLVHFYVVHQKLLFATESKLYDFDSAFYCASVLEFYLGAN